MKNYHTPFICAGLALCFGAKSGLESAHHYFVADRIESLPTFQMSRAKYLAASLLSDKLLEVKNSDTFWASQNFSTLTKSVPQYRASLVQEAQQIMPKKIYDELSSVVTEEKRDFRESLSDLGVSLFCAGVLGFIGHYIKRKENQDGQK